MSFNVKKGIVWFDIETPKEANDVMVAEGSAVAQIAAVATDFELTTLEEFQVKIAFKESEADPLILQKIGYDRDVWKEEAVMPKEASILFRDFAKNYACVTKVTAYGKPYQSVILAGHNIRSFDIPVLLNWYKKVNNHYNTDIWFPGSTNPSFDTRSLIGLFGFLRGSFFPKESLTYLCQRFGIETEGRHDAVADIEKTIQLAKIITSKINLNISGEMENEQTAIDLQVAS